ncbi:MAG TPA: glycosyltransferase family 4 protein [Lacibacter sp.]|nr:glycosyltransferase family 4 protein [Lacibacter sp.]HMO90223.1 glycosyltransferase family 4 protein [Lacibacter sp.]HMP87656.1 glycosyltransferase family 4 protein [Lacibacter sp.]
MQEKHILLYTPSLHTGGGTERVLVNLANALQERGFAVTILTNKQGSSNLYQLHPGIQTALFGFAALRDRHPRNLLFKIINKLLGPALLTRFLRKQVRRSTRWILGFSPDITNDCFRTPYREKLIAFEHFPFEHYNRFAKAQQQIRRNFPQLKHVVVLTEHEKNVYEGLGCRVTKIPNSYPFEPGTPAALENKIVLSVGHFNQQKRRDLLVEAWSAVHRRHPDWQLHIVGKGPDLPAVQEQIKRLGLMDSIRIIEPTRAIQTHYQQASVFVLSSAFESFSLVLLEARICGVPCVSFDVVCGPNELITQEQDGFLVRFPDTAAMAQAICQLVEDSQLRITFGARSREDAIRRYHPDAIYQQWENLLGQP